MQALNYQFNPQFHDLDHLDVPLHLPTQPLKHNQAMSIAPWDDSQATQGILNRFENFSSVRKNLSENYPVKETQNQHVHNFINGTPKGRKNRSDLGKLRKRLQQNKGQNYHLNLNKIEFLQYQKNQSNPFYQKSLHSNPKPNVKDFSSIQNNFFIKSYFFPNNPKMAKKDEPMSLEAKRQKQYRKIKEIKGPSFIAIKSVDLKQKFPIENEEQNDSDSSVDPQTERFYSNFRTITVLGSRNHRRARNVSMQENYSPSVQFENQKYKTIESTKESTREMTDSIKEKNFRNLDEKLINRISQSSKNPVIITTNSSFVRKRGSRKSVKLNLSSSKLEDMEDSGQTTETKKNKLTQRTSQDDQDIQVSYTKKQFTIKKDKPSRISALQQLQQKNELEGLIQVLPAYSEQKSSTSQQHTQNIQISSRSISKNKKLQRQEKSFQVGTRIRKRLENSSLNKTLRIFDRMHPIERAQLS